MIKWLLQPENIYSDKRLEKKICQNGKYRLGTTLLVPQPSNLFMLSRVYLKKCS